jgi:hypothetical protein
MTQPLVREVVGSSLAQSNCVRFYWCDSRRALLWYHSLLTSFTAPYCYQAAMVTLELHFGPVAEALATPDAS